MENLRRENFPPENLLGPWVSISAGTSQPGLLVPPEWLPACDRRLLAKLPQVRQSVQKPAEVVNRKLQLILLFFVMWVRGYKEVLPAAYKGVGPAHLSRVKLETYGNEVSRVGDGVN